MVGLSVDTYYIYDVWILSIFVFCPVIKCVIDSILSWWLLKCFRSCCGNFVVDRFVVTFYEVSASVKTVGLHTRLITLLSTQTTSSLCVSTSWMEDVRGRHVVTFIRLHISPNQSPRALVQWVSTLFTALLFSFTNCINSFV